MVNVLILKKLMVSFLSLVAGASLIGLGAPRMIAAFVMFPSGPVIKKIQALQPAEPEELETLIASQKRGLSWSESGSMWMDLGLAQSLLAKKKKHDSPERIQLVDDAILSLRTGLEMSPLSPFAWMRLASVELLKAGPSPAAMSAFRLGLNMAPYEPYLAIARIYMGMALWSDLQPDERRLILQQARYAWNYRNGKKRLVEFVKNRPNHANLVRAALIRTPKKLAAFEDLLKILSK